LLLDCGYLNSYWRILGETIANWEGSRVMIGLVNAIGASQAGRVQSTERAATAPSDVEVDRVPFLNNEAAASHVLRKAVESIENWETAMQRETPGGENSDRSAQTDLEAKVPVGVGAFLDVMA
jgi:hypothetical protein